MKRAYWYYRSFRLLCYIAMLPLAIIFSTTDIQLLTLRRVDLSIPSVSAQEDKERRAAELFELRRQRLENLKPLFEQHSIPFSPEELVHDNWRRRLGPVFKSMPEMKLTRTAGKYLSGVYIADVLILPEKVETTGDTFILANHLVYEGPNPRISGEGGLYIYPIKSDNVRRIKIDPMSGESPEEIDQMISYMRWIFQKNGDLPSAGELPPAIKLPEHAKKIRVIGSYVYFQHTLRESIDK